MNEFTHKTTGRGTHPRARRMQHRRVRHLHSHRHHHVGGCGSAAVQDAGRRERGQRIPAVHELHRALAHVTRTGDEQLRGEAAQIVAEATSRLSGLLAADR
jgi:hypothetical protein